MKPKPAGPATIDEYIAAFPAETRDRLQAVRATIREAAPRAAETISYGIPTFTLNGRYLIYFAAYKKHLSLYPAPVGIPEFESALAQYKSGKGTLQFPHSQPLPLDLIHRIVRYRAAKTP
ncbi:MAG TPA: DUF1801 domain-containing protein [Anaerolineales bacterium]